MRGVVAVALVDVCRVGVAVDRGLRSVDLGRVLVDVVVVRFRDGELLSSGELSSKRGLGFVCEVDITGGCGDHRRTVISY